MIYGFTLSQDWMLNILKHGRLINTLLYLLAELERCENGCRHAEPDIRYSNMCRGNATGAAQRTRGKQCTLTAHSFCICILSI